MNDTAHDTAAPSQPVWKRALFGLGTAAATAVAVTFATIGDGVDVPDAHGPRHLIIEHGHTFVWVLLAAAFAIATLRGRWTRPANGVAIAAGIVYAVFLIAVFVWP